MPLILIFARAISILYLFCPLLFKPRRLYLFLINEGTLQNIRNEMPYFYSTKKYIYSILTKDKSRPRKQKVEGMYGYIFPFFLFFSISLFSSKDISSSLKRAELPPRIEKRRKKKTKKKREISRKEIYIIGWTIYFFFLEAGFYFEHKIRTKNPLQFETTVKRDICFVL